MSESVVAYRAKVKYPTEVLTYSFVFSNLLQNGETIASVVSVVDPSSTLTIGSEAVTSQTTYDDDQNPIPPAEAVTFSVGGGVADVDYRLEVTVTTTTGNTRAGVGVLQVRNGNLW